MEIGSGARQDDLLSSVTEKQRNELALSKRKLTDQEKHYNQYCLVTILQSHTKMFIQAIHSITHSCI